MPFDPNLSKEYLQVLSGMFQITLAELIIYNNFAIQFGIGIVKNLFKNKIWQITNQLLKEFVPTKRSV